MGLFRAGHPRPRAERTDRSPAQGMGGELRIEDFA